MVLTFVFGWLVLLLSLLWNKRQNDVFLKTGNMSESLEYQIKCW